MKKRVRIDRYEEGSENEVHLLALHSPRGAGAKRIVVDPSLYVAQPCDIVTDSWVADNTMRRMYELMSYNNPNGVWYPINKKPAGANWTAVADDTPQYTQLTIHGRRILFFAVGSIYDSSILLRPNDLSPRLRLQIELLRQVDRIAAAELFNSGSSHGKVAPTAMTTLSASTRADTAVGVPPFKRVYDATEYYSKKSAMALVEPLSLFPGDIVLSELYLIRSEEQFGATSAAFHLNAVNVLCWGPRPTRVAQMDPEPDFPDVI